MSGSVGGDLKMTASARRRLQMHVGTHTDGVCTPPADRECLRSVPSQKHSWGGKPLAPLLH